VPAGIELVFGPADTAAAAEAEQQQAAPPPKEAVSGAKGVTFDDDVKRKAERKATAAAEKREPSAVGEAAPGAAASTKPLLAPQPTGLDEANGVERALANAQRLKENMQAEVTKLKQTAEALAKDVEVARAKSDEFESKGLRLHQLATQSRVLEESNASREHSLADAQKRASAKLDPLAFDEKPPSSKPSSIHGSTQDLAGADSATSSSGERKGRISEKNPPAVETRAAGADGDMTLQQTTAGPVMYLSTVLIMMLLAYAVGVTVRVTRHRGNPVEFVDFLPQDLQDMSRSWLAVFTDIVNRFVQK
jgi:hypothetical protein